MIRYILIICTVLTLGCTSKKVIPSTSDIKDTIALSVNEPNIIKEHSSTKVKVLKSVVRDEAEVLIKTKTNGTIEVKVNLVGDSLEIQIQGSAEISYKKVRTEVKKETSILGSKTLYNIDETLKNKDKIPEVTKPDFKRYKVGTGLGLFILIIIIMILIKNRKK